jgi:hypothetical protein
MLRSWLQHGRIAGRKAGYDAVLLAGCAAALSLVLAASHFPRCRAGRRASKKRERERGREREMETKSSLILQIIGGDPAALLSYL